MSGYYVSGTFKCRYCGHTEDKRSPNHTVCDRLTCRKRQKLAQSTRNRASGTLTYAGARQRKVRHISDNSKYGRRIIEPLGPPKCACGELVKFGSDPMSGTSLEWCPRCGERPLTRYGVVQYNQRVVLDDEIELAVERAGKVPNPVFSGQGGKSYRRRSYEYVRSA